MVVGVITMSTTLELSGSVGDRGVAAPPRRRRRWRAPAAAALAAVVTVLGSLVVAPSIAGAYPLGPGYWLTTASGHVFRFGQAQTFGTRLVSGAVVGTSADPFLEGYWLATATGHVYNFGSAKFYGSLTGKSVPSPIAGIASTSTSLGYWLVARNGTVYHFGDARWHGKPRTVGGHVVGIARTPDSGGYWIATSAGNVYNFGNAAFRGSLAGHKLTKPVVAIASTLSGQGYWIVQSNGAVTAFGNAHNYGGTSKLRLPAPITGMSLDRTGRGYWLTTATGHVYNFGNAVNYGSLTSKPSSPIVSVATRPALAVKVDAYVGTTSETSNWVKVNTTWELSLHKATSGTTPAGARVLGVEGLQVKQLKTIGFTYKSGKCNVNEPYFLLYARNVSTGHLYHRIYACKYGGGTVNKRFNPVTGVTGAAPLPGTYVVTSLDIVEPVKNTTTRITDIVVAGITVRDWRTFTAAGTIIG